MKTTLLLITAFFLSVSNIKAQDKKTITTNATCQLGQERITRELKQLEGVFEVKFDTKGTITLDYSSDGTPYDDIVKKVTECGFTANGIEPKNGDKNLCKSLINTKKRKS